MHIKTLTTLALAGLLAACGALAAEKGELREETALQNAKVTLPQAIATAEQQTGGRAYEAGVDLKHGEPRIAVETNGPKGVQTVFVDAQTGQVVGTHAGAEPD
jgi:uncharacterized membrane protein YkoI